MEALTGPAHLCPPRAALAALTGRKPDRQSLFSSPLTSGRRLGAHPVLDPCACGRSCQLKTCKSPITQTALLALSVIRGPGDRGSGRQGAQGGWGLASVLVWWRQVCLAGMQPPPRPPSPLPPAGRAAGERTRPVALPTCDSHRSVEMTQGHPVKSHGSDTLTQGVRTGSSRWAGLGRPWDGPGSASPPSAQPLPCRGHM